MNKKELAEIRKQFKKENDKFVINNIRTYLIKDKDMIKMSNKKRIADFGGLPGGSSKVYVGESDADLYYDMFKKTLGGQLGKGLVEYSFPNDIMMNENTNYAKLLNLVNTSMESDEDAEEYIHIMLKDLNCEFNNFVIVLAHCTYSIPVKSKSVDGGIDEEEEGKEFSFILGNVCGLKTPDLGLCYYEDKDDITKGYSDDCEIENPKYGFLFPVFNDRDTCVNSFLAYNKDVKNPNKSMIENIFECTFELSVEEEQNAFNNIVAKLAAGGGDAAETTVEYDIIQNIHTNITDMINHNIMETEITKLSAGEVKKILERSGISKEKLADFDEVYEEEVGDLGTELIASNLITPKLNLKSNEITINVSPNKTDNVSAQVVDGRKCLVIALDESVQVNGLSVTL